MATQLLQQQWTHFLIRERSESWSMQQHELGNWTDLSMCLLHCQIIVEEMCGRPHPQEHIAPEHS